VNQDQAAELAALGIEILSESPPCTFAEAWYQVNSAHHFWFDWRFTALKRLLADLQIPLSSHLQALDVGCGPGILREQLEGAGRWSVTGTDLNTAALAASGCFRGRTLFYDVTDRREEFLSFFDVVLLFDVIEHLKDPSDVLEACLAHLKPGGILLLNVPSLPLLYSRYDEAAGHHRRYLTGSLRKQAAALEAEVLDIRYWGLSLVPILLLRKVFLTGFVSEDKIIRVGFDPPSPWINSALRSMGRLEQGFLSHPFLGSSLLLAARKDASH
jgi:2-polyprenyl-3-methyl-5-hydroxy-6-metoxy-1,4-benzoquinol methylase